MPSRQERRKRQRRVDVVLDVEQGVEHHRPAIVHVDEIGVDARVFVIIRRPAINAVLAQIGCALRLRPGLARIDFRVLGESEFDHYRRSFRIMSFNPDQISLSRRP